MAADKDIPEYNIFEIMDTPREYFSISEPKLEISSIIKDASDANNLSLRTMAEKIKELYGDETKTPHYNTLQQITSGHNYTIESLLMLLDLLDKKIVIVDRTSEEKQRIENRGK
jgi:hypothetical protein